jgi:hypothetical protein
MTHRGADWLSEAIDRWLSGLEKADQGYEGHLGDVLDILSGSLPAIPDETAKARVRRRLAAYAARPRSPQQLLMERATDNVVRMGRRMTEEEYVPWTTAAGAAAVLLIAVIAVAWLRRRGIGERTQI